MNDTYCTSGYSGVRRFHGIIHQDRSPLRSDLTNGRDSSLPRGYCLTESIDLGGAIQLIRSRFRSDVALSDDLSATLRRRLFISC